MCNIFVHSTIAFSISKYATITTNVVESERNKIPPFFFSYKGKHLRKSPSACLKALYILPNPFCLFLERFNLSECLKPTIICILRFRHSRSSGLFEALPD